MHIVLTWIAVSDGSMENIEAEGSRMSRIRDPQQFIEHICEIFHHRNEHGRLAVFVHSFRQGRLSFYQLEREHPLSSSDSVVERIAPKPVLL